MTGGEVFFQEWDEYLERQSPENSQENQTFDGNTAETSLFPQVQQESKETTSCQLAPDGTVVFVHFDSHPDEYVTGSELMDEELTSTSDSVIADPPDWFLKKTAVETSTLPATVDPSSEVPSSPTAIAHLANKNTRKATSARTPQIASAKDVATRGISPTGKSLQRSRREQVSQIQREHQTTSVIHIQVGEEPLIPWKQRVQQWLKGAGGNAFGLSTVLHLLLLILMAMWIVTQQRKQGMEELLFTITDQHGIVDVEEEAFEVPLPQEDLVIAAPSDQVPLEEPLPPIDNNLDLPSLFPHADENAVQNAGMPNLPKAFKPGKNAVRKGSFTAWTVPEDPDPFIPYRIHILIKVPKRLKEYPLKDLDGSNVVGTDQYRQVIPDATHFEEVAKPNQGFVLIVVYVPGALLKNVRDTIFLRSKLLKEKQTLKIVF